MNLRKAFGPVAMILLLAQATVAQHRPSLSFVPEKVMNAEFPALNESETIRLKTYRNKVFILALWASWCPACWMAFDKINKVHERFSPDGVEVIGLTMEDPKADGDKARSFARTYDIRFKLGWISEEMGKALTEQEALPQIFVIAEDGLIVRRFIGWHPDKTLKLLRRTVKQAREKPPVMQ